jgi:hypothetical protein
MKTPKDIRSTGRKRLRAVLFRTRRPYCCSNCGISTTLRPPDAPKNFEEFWPTENRLLDIALDANHINKNLLDIDPSNAEWLCKKCHKQKDLQTNKGVSTIENEFGY